MRIVLLTTLVPNGPPSGGVYATLELSRLLARYGVVERWAVWALDSQSDPATIWQGTRPVSLSGLRAHGIPRALYKRLPLSVARFYRADFAASLKAIPPADVLFIDHVAMCQYAGCVTAARTAVYSHNVEAEIYERAVRLEPSFLKRAIWRYEASAMRAYEGNVLRLADAVVCPGTRDADLLQERYGVRAHVWYPPVADAQPVAPKNGRGVCVGSVGTMTWQATRWGMDWFVREVWPLVLQRMPNARLRVAGRGSAELPYHASNGVERLGPISDLHAFYEDTDVVVAPIRGGAGIKVRVMDAAARGLPVVTTSSGVEGLGSILPNGIRVADGSDAFADEVCSILKSRVQLPIIENIAWYEQLVRTGGGAIARAIAPSG